MTEKKEFVIQDHVTVEQQEKYVQKYGNYNYRCLEDVIPASYIEQNR